MSNTCTAIRGQSNNEMENMNCDDHIGESAILGEIVKYVNGLKGKVRDLYNLGMKSMNRKTT